MKIAKRYLAVVLSFALFLALPLAFTQEAAAASKGTKIYQPSLKVISSTDKDGDTSTSMDAYFYNNKGLKSQVVDKEGYSTAYVYNKSGYVTSQTHLDKDGKPTDQTVYDVKKGKTVGIANYDIDGANVKLTDFSKISYKKGNVSKVISANADGTEPQVIVNTYKKGVLSKSVSTWTNEYGTNQTIELYDKYGNITNSTTVWNTKDGSYSYTGTTVYKNTYKSGKLVKAAYAYAWSDSDGDKTENTGLTVYTYKKGKLVKTVNAYTYNSNPDITYGKTCTYAYTKGGLIKAKSWAKTSTTATETKITSSGSKAYQYKKIAVNSKCVKAVKEAMEEEYSYEAYLPGYKNADYDYDE